MKEFLFTLLFPKKNRYLNQAKIDHDYYEDELRKRNELIRELRDKLDEVKKPVGTMEDLMRASIGLPMIDFANVDNDEGKPPHYLEGLTDDQRKNFIASMETIYVDEKFQKVVSYVINLLGNHSIQKADEDKMRNGRLGIIGIRTLTAEFLKAHNEHVSAKKKDEGFDPLGILPE